MIFLLTVILLVNKTICYQWFIRYMECGDNASAYLPEWAEVNNCLHCMEYRQKTVIFTLLRINGWILSKGTKIAQKQPWDMLISFTLYWEIPDKKHDLSGFYLYRLDRTLYKVSSKVYSNEFSFIIKSIDIWIVFSKWKIGVKCPVF